jgi:hypothetical protein
LIVDTKDSKQAKPYSSFSFSSIPIANSSCCARSEISLASAFLSTSPWSFQVGASSQAFAVYAAKRNLKLEDLSVSKGDIIVPGLAILEFILISC